MRDTYYLIGLVLVAACGGGSDLDPGSGDDPGGGTQTLFVDGSLVAKPRIANAQRAADFDTSLSVRILTATQQVVSTGVVTVTSSSGSFDLLFRSDENRWEGTAPGYDEVYVLDIESGADVVEGVRVDGPDIHAFTKPTMGATVDSRMILEVAWDSDQEADTAGLDAEEIDEIAIPDTGVYMLAAGSLKADQDQARENRIELERRDRVTPAGALPGSELEVGVENFIQVIAQPDPTL
jgi:hypothetical protein